MKQYVIDELRLGDYEKIKVYMDEHYGESMIDGICWIRVPDKILNDLQHSHIECQPFYIAVEMNPQRISCEFLIRTQKRIRCECIGYADEKQRRWIMDLMDSIFETTGVKC